MQWWAMRRQGGRATAVPEPHVVENQLAPDIRQRDAWQMPWVNLVFDSMDSGNGFQFFLT